MAGLIRIFKGVSLHPWKGKIFINDSSYAFSFIWG